MKYMKFRRSGFTLVEIMIAVAIIGLLAAMAIPGVIRARDNSREKACVNNLRQLDGAKDQDALENGLGTGDASANLDVYIKGGVPECPLGDAYVVGNIGTDPTCANADAATGEHVLPGAAAVVAP